MRRIKIKLENIMIEIAEVENELAYGGIDYELDRVGLALRQHPADILDSIFAPIGNRIYILGEDSVSKEELKDFLEQLIFFKDNFQIKEMEKPINHLSTYLNPTEKNK